MIYPVKFFTRGSEMLYNSTRIIPATPFKEAQMRVYNFSAGPGMLPLEVLQEAGKQITDYEGSGMSVMELSHRGKWYEPIHNECISLVRELMNVSDEYEVLLLQGGASTQFESVPLNLLKRAARIMW